MNFLQPSIRIIIILLSLVYSGCSSDDEPLQDALDQGQMTHSLQEADGYTAPEGNLIINNDNVSTNLTSVQVSLKAQDVVSVDRYFLSDNASTPTVNSSGWVNIGSGGEWSLDTTYSLSTIEGSQNLYVWYLDRTNNISDRISDSIIYDITAPSSASVSLTSGKDSTHQRNESFSIAANDIVGVISYNLSESSIQPKLGNSDWSDTTSTTSFTGTSLFTLSSREGTKTVYAWFRDFAGNISNEVNTTFILDQTAPTGSISINNDATWTSKTSVTLNLSATDSIGVVAYYISTNSFTPIASDAQWQNITPATSYSANISFDLGSLIGKKYVYAWFKDAEENVSSVYSDYILTIINFDDGILPSDFSMSGSNSWFISSYTSYSGNYSLRSGNIGDSQSSCVTLSQSTGSGTFSFYYKVSSESGYDYFRFYINGSLRLSRSGDRNNWTQYSRIINSGTNTFKWCYSKDGNIYGGSDAAWIDSIILP